MWYNYMQIHGRVRADIFLRACRVGRRIFTNPNDKEVGTVTVYEALSLIVQSGIFLVGLIGLIAMLIKYIGANNDKK